MQVHLLPCQQTHFLIHETRPHVYGTRLSQLHTHRSGREQCEEWAVLALGAAAVKTECK